MLYGLQPAESCVSDRCGGFVDCGQAKLAGGAVQGKAANSEGQQEIKAFPELPLRQRTQVGSRSEDRGADTMQ
jgi:hypothetical protein